jgi:two-component SAPR family response regulator
MSQATHLATKMQLPNNVGAVPFDIGSSTMPAEVSALQYRWKIRCLGNFRIYRRDGTPIRWDAIHGATVKTKTLFAFLLQNATNGASAEEIADLLWPEAHDMVQSLNRLYHTVHCLRLALDPQFSSTHESPYLICRDHRYYLTLPEGTWVDAPIFEQYCRRGEQLLRANELEDSLACHHVAEKLYSGPLFADIPSKYADNIGHDWCWSRRYRLGEIYVKMLTYTARIYRQLGTPEQTIAYAEKALLLQPCFESAHQELIRAFHGLGRRDALERQYRLCCEVLKRFEARAPSSETRALVQSLMTT